MKDKVSVVFVCMGNKVAHQRKALRYAGLRLMRVKMVTRTDTPLLSDTLSKARKYANICLWIHRKSRDKLPRCFQHADTWSASLRRC